MRVDEIRLLIPAPADPTMPTAPIRIIGVWVMVHVAAVTGIIAPAPSPGGAGIGGKSDEHQRKPARRREQCRKPFHRTPPSLFRATDARAKPESPARCSRSRPTSYCADDEEVPRVPGHSKARQQCLARQYSGHDALPADCKFRWQPIAAELRITTSDPPYLATQSPQ